MAIHIGVFDSGVGGLTVVHALRETLPGCSITYLGDTARLPYGTKSPRTVERYSLACQRFLLERDVEMVLIACNTASANALPALMEVSPVPVIGAVEPGALSATRATRCGRIGVIGTQATVRSGAYERAITRLVPDAQVTTLACPLLVPLAEEGWTDDEIAAAVARRYLTELFDRDPDIDTLVLGCTHYPLLRAVLARTAEEIAGERSGSGTERSKERGGRVGVAGDGRAPEIAVVDSATAMADAARVAMESLPGRRSGGELRSGALRMFATDTSRLDQLGPLFLGEPVASFELVDL